MTTRARILGASAVVAGIVAVVVLLWTRPGTGTAPSPSPSPSLEAQAPSTSPSSATASAAPSLTVGPPPLQGFIRVDQLGFVPDESKIAYLLAPAPADGATFTVVDAAGAEVLRGTAGPDRGPWNDAWPAVHPLDLTALNVPGTYRIEMTGSVEATSPTFTIGTAAELFAPRVADAVAFFQAQRDGPDVIPGELGRKPSHLNDRDLDVYAWPTYEDPDSDTIVGRSLRRIDRHVDLSGGWFDAGDFIKFTHTTAYSVGLMYLAQRELGDAAPAELGTEARFGQDWLARAWDPETGTMYLQVGIGSGNTAGTFNGDHDLWRLPEVDDTLAGRENRYLRSRPAFRANDPGTRLPPNLAGRMAAAFALAAQVDAAADPARARRELATAASIFRRAKTAKVTDADVVTALPHAFYPESSWRDDLEWGAAELALAGQALGDPRADDWLRDSARWAAQYIDHEAGHDTLNLYDTIGCGARGPGPGDARGSVGERPRHGRDPAGRRPPVPAGHGRRRAPKETRSRPGPSTTTSTRPRTRSGSWRRSASTRTSPAQTNFGAFATRQRDWALGANPWGASLMIGVGTDFPRCPQHVVANLSGSQDGSPPILRGAIVNGPNSADLFTDGLGEFFEEGHDLPARWRRHLRRVQRPREPVRRRRPLVADRRARHRLHVRRAAGVRAAPVIEAAMRGAPVARSVASSASNGGLHEHRTHRSRTPVRPGGGPR